MSREEKRRRLLEIPTEGQEYSLKDLEKMAKYKGMMQNQVKDILQELLDWILKAGVARNSTSNKHFAIPEDLDYLEEWNSLTTPLKRLSQH